MNYLANLRLITLPLLALLTSACFSPFADQIATTKPKASDVAGVYILKSQSMSDDRKLNFLQGQSATIELLQNGTYKAANFPVWRLDGSGHFVFGSLQTKTGSWQIGTMGSVDSRTAWGVWLAPSIDSMSGSPNLTNDKPPYGLLFTYGDPDSGNALIFEKPN